MTGLKLKEIKFKNHVALDNMRCEFNGSYTEIIGMNGKGKSSIINGLWIGFKGIAEKGKDYLIGERFRFFAPGKKSADVNIILIDERADGAEIEISRHITKSSNGKLTFKAPPGYPISQEWLEGLFSVSFMSAKNFTALSGKDQALALGINTAEFDAKIRELKGQFTELNGVYRNMPELEVVEAVNRIDLVEFSEKKAKLEADFNKQYETNKKHNADLRKEYQEEKTTAQKKAQEFNGKQNILADQRKKAFDFVMALERALSDLHSVGYKSDHNIEPGGAHKWYDSLAEPDQLIDWENLKIEEPEYIEEMPDRTALNEIDIEMAAAYETNKKADAYQTYLDTLNKRAEQKKKLTKNQEAQGKVEQKKIEYIQGREMPFAGLGIDENGGLILEGKPIRHPNFSQGQLVKIVAKLATTMNPELKITFIDDFDLLDEENQKEIPEYLIEKGHQIIVAKVGRSAPGENIITLSPLEEEEKKETIL